MNNIEKLWKVVLRNKNKSNGIVNFNLIASEGKWTSPPCDMCIDDMFNVIYWIETNHTKRTIKKNFGSIDLYSQLETHLEEQIYD